MADEPDEDHAIGSKHRVDRLIGALADRQHGVVARWQLLDAGVGGRGIDHRLATGRLFLKHKGVYAAGIPTLSPKGHWMAAVLAGGPTAVLSHRSAAALHVIRDSTHPKIDVSVPIWRRDRPTIKFHQATLHPEDITVVYRIPVTSIARTILDLAGVINNDQLLRAVEAAERLEKFDLVALERAMARRPKARGSVTLKQILADYRGPPLTRSELERDFWALIDKAGLPAPQTNTIVAGYEVDMFWPQYGLVVEIDGLGYHRSPRAFESDRIRDATLQRHGYRVLRITSKRLKNDPEGVINDVLALIELAA